MKHIKIQLFAQRALGTSLKIGAAAGTKVAGLTSIGGIELTAETIDVTTLDSAGGYRDFIAGFKDAGEVSLEGFLESATGKGQKELYALLESGAVEDFTIDLAGGAKWAFKGVVVGFSTGADLEDALSFSGSIKVSGKPTFTGAA